MKHYRNPKKPNREPRKNGYRNDSNSEDIRVMGAFSIDVTTRLSCNGFWLEAEYWFQEKDSSSFGRMRIGEDYQATIPDLISESERNSDKYDEFFEMPPMDLCLWYPPTENQLSEQQFNDYINNARSIYGYSIEQALGLLSFHKHNLMKANDDMKSFSPYLSCESIKTDEDKALFEKAFKSRGKDFFRIQTQVLPKKSIKFLVEYYYLSKHKVARRRKRKKNTPNVGKEKLPKLVENTNQSIESELNREVDCLTLAKDDETIGLKVLGPDNLIVSFRINKLDPLRNLMMKYCNQAGLPVANAHFRFDGVTIFERDTPSLLEMNEDDIINVYKDKRDWISVRRPQFCDE